MKRWHYVGVILLAGLMTGCGSHLTCRLTAGRQMPMTATNGGISIPLNHSSEVQLNLRGCQMGLSNQPKNRDGFDESFNPLPWLNYRVHF
ncbi:MAG: hypothetical protein QNJ22_10860 [Desulfosarcinaceae bacterium]|nr:hypothetical protein [Desulfosarcinaceae bacterium]